MPNTRESRIQFLLDSTGKAANEITHSLSELGEGKMSDGLFAIWKDGQQNGMIKGAICSSLIFSTVIGGYVLIKNSLEERKIKEKLAKPTSITQEELTKDTTLNEESDSSDGSISK